MTDEISLISKWKTTLKEIEHSTGIPAYYVLFILGVAVSFVFFGLFDRLITYIIGTSVPLIKTLELLTESESNIFKKKAVLRYWSLFGFVSFLDVTLGFVLKLIPFYNLLKITLLIWLYMPNFYGANVIYQLVVSTFFSKFESKISDATGRVESTMRDYFGSYNN